MSFDMVKLANDLLRQPVAPDLGLNIDMIDADRLDAISLRVTDERDADFLHDLAGRVRREVREVLELRAKQK